MNQAHTRTSSLMNTDAGHMRADAPTEVPHARERGDEPPAPLIVDDPVNILIVDDEPKNLTVLETVLNDPAYRLVRAESPDQALLALVVEEFALLILDIRMPGMTGFELAQMIKNRKKNAHVPIIFLTAYYNDDQHILTGYDTGAVDYMHKPVNPAVLRSKVAVFVELHRKNRECELANRALLGEVVERRRAEDQLRELNERLDRRVIERSEALYESERRLRAIFDGTHEHMGLLTPDGNLCEANRASLEFAGCTREDVVGRPYWETVWFRFTPGAPEFVRGAVERAAAGEPVRFETPLVTVSGETKVFEIAFHPIRDDSGRVSLIIPVSLDITQRKRAEDALKEADRLKDEFLAMLAHELRNPLAAISTATHLLQRGEPTGHDRDWGLSIVQRQTRHLTRLIDDLLDVSRITRGKLQLQRHPLELREVIRRTLESLQGILESKNHDLRVNLAEEPLIVDADPARLEQVFGNLLTNAVKYTDEGGYITLTAARDGADVVVRVRDTGIGIEPEPLAHVFEPFTQVDASLDRSQGGLGIGLTLVKSIVEMHHGSVSATSEGAGKGSEFTVRLPGSASTEPSHPEDRPLSTRRNERPRRNTACRILVVDDNVDTVKSTAKFLKAEGYELSIAHDGAEGLAVARRFLPDLVLLDIGLPVMNGYELARALRKDDHLKHAVLIAVSGYGQEQDRARARESGFDHHLIKPVDLDSLLALLDSLRPIR